MPWKFEACVVLGAVLLILVLPKAQAGKVLDLLELFTKGADGVRRARIWVGFVVGMAALAIWTVQAWRSGDPTALWVPGLLLMSAAVFAGAVALARRGKPRKRAS